MAKIIELIYTEERKGTGKETDPIRLCPQLWTKDGLLVADYEIGIEGDEIMFFNPRQVG